jgi:outer membrane murein-binding lipoprotein Lpp
VDVRVEAELRHKVNRLEAEVETLQARLAEVEAAGRALAENVSALLARRGGC